MELEKGKQRLLCIVGCYSIRIAYCCIEVCECPFVASAWDACRVLLADVSMGEVGIESSFKGWIYLFLLLKLIFIVYYFLKAAAYCHSLN